MQDPIDAEDDWDLAEQLQDTLDNPDNASMRIQDVPVSDDDDLPTSSSTSLRGLLWPTNLLHSVNTDAKRFILCKTVVFWR